MSNDPVPTYKRFMAATGSTVTTDTASPVAPESEDDWGLPDQTEKMSTKELRRRHRGLIELLRRTGRGEANPKGGMQLVIIAAQYLAQELAHRSQNRQTKAIIWMTVAITVMTAFIMAGTIWPDGEWVEWVQSTAHSLLIYASQVIDLWWQHGRSLARAIYPHA
jgi:hypothetical protein